MSDTGLNSMIQATKDHMIDAINFSQLGRPTASYVVERKTIRMPFLAPEYKADGVTVLRCTLADHGWLDPSSLFLQCLVTNTTTTTNSMLVPLTFSINGAFNRGRSRSWGLLEPTSQKARASVCFTSQILGL